MKRRHKFQLLFSVLNILMVTITAPLIIDNLYLGITYIVFYLFASSLLYFRYVKGVKPKYPLASPVKDQDVYFPRTNIPRPIYRDYREHPEFFEKKKKKEEEFCARTRLQVSSIRCRP